MRVVRIDSRHFCRKSGLLLSPFFSLYNNEFSTPFTAPSSKFCFALLQYVKNKCRNLQKRQRVLPYEAFWYCEIKKASFPPSCMKNFDDRNQRVPPVLFFFRTKSWYPLDYPNFQAREMGSTDFEVCSASLNWLWLPFNLILLNFLKLICFLICHELHCQWTWPVFLTSGSCLYYNQLLQPCFIILTSD